MTVSPDTAIKSSLFPLFLSFRLLPCLWLFDYEFGVYYTWMNWVLLEQLNDGKAWRFVIEFSVNHRRIRTSLSLSLHSLLNSLQILIVSFVIYRIGVDWRVGKGKWSAIDWLSFASRVKMACLSHSFFSFSSLQVQQSTLCVESQRVFESIVV